MVPLNDIQEPPQSNCHQHIVKQEHRCAFSSQDPSSNRLALETPWLTGTLLSPTGTAVPLGSAQLQGYVYFLSKQGTYTANGNVIQTPCFSTINPQVECLIGIAPWMDLSWTVQALYNQTTVDHKKYHGRGFGDLSIGVDLQLYPAIANHFPGIKLSIGELFPTGKFDHLDKSRYLTDQTGQGAFATSLELVLYNIYHILPSHFLSLTVSSSYTWNHLIHPKGFNGYSRSIPLPYSDIQAIYPGSSWQGMLSIEWSLSQRLVFAFDALYSHTNKTQAVVSQIDKTIRCNIPKQDQISMAPALEWNFSPSFGICGGTWFTLWGCQAPRFFNWILFINYNY